MANETDYLWKDRKHHLWFPLSFTSYYIENERLMIKEGFLNTTLEDLTFRQSLAGKLFGTGDIILKTKVDTTPEITLKNIKKPIEVRRLLSQAIEESRRSSNIVGKEFYSGQSHEHMDLNEDGLCDFDHNPI